MADRSEIHPTLAFSLAPFTTMMDRFAIAPLLIPISVGLGVPLSAATVVATGYYLAYGLTPALYGVLADRYGRVRIMRAALAGVAITDGLTALAPNLVILVALRVLTGGIACGVLPVALVYVGDRFPFQIRQQAIADLLVWVALGTAAGTLGAGVVAHVASWRLFFLVPAVLAAGIAVALRRLPESLKAAEPVDPLGQVVRVFQHPWALLLFALAILDGAVMFGFVVYLAPALEAHGENAAIAGLVVAGYGIAVLGGARVFRQIARRLRPPLILALGALMILVGFLLAARAQDVPSVFAASILAGGAYAFMHSTFQTWATDVVPQARGTAAALFVTFVFTGASIATASMAGLAGGHQFARIFLIGAVVTAPVLVVGAIARWHYPGSDQSVIAVTP